MDVMESGTDIDPRAREADFLAAWDRGYLCGVTGQRCYAPAPGIDPYGFAYGWMEGMQASKEPRH